MDLRGRREFGLGQGIAAAVVAGLVPATHALVTSAHDAVDERAVSPEFREEPKKKAAPEGAALFGKERRNL